MKSVDSYFDYAQYSLRMPVIFLIFFVACSTPFCITCHSKKQYTQQFSQEFLATIAQKDESKPSTFSMLDKLYLHTHTQTHPQQQPIIIVQNSNNWLIKYSIISIVVLWGLFKFQQGLSCIVGQTISTKLLKSFFMSMFTSTVWIIQKLSTELFTLIYKIICLTINREIA